MKRYGKVIGMRAEKLDKYLRLHQDVWPEVEQAMAASNIVNFTIFLRQLPDGKHYLFCYFEYTGDDYDADMARVAADSTTQQWWALTEPCQEPLPDRAPGQWWADMQEVVHHL